MATETIEFVALQDEAGHYYLLSQSTVEGARVADAAVAQLEAVLSGTADEDVRGYVIAPPQTPAATRYTPGAQRFSSRGIIVVGGYEGLRLAGISFAQR